MGVLSITSDDPSIFVMNYSRKQHIELVKMSAAFDVIDKN